MKYLFITVLLAIIIKTGYAIQCYECNSFKDSRCSHSKLPDELKKNCSEHDKGNKHILCRKIIQMVEFAVQGMPTNTRVIRTCGWDDSKYKNTCYHRSGYGGKQEVCSCQNDLCNSAIRNNIGCVLTILSSLTFLYHNRK